MRILRPCVYAGSGELVFLLDWGLNLKQQKDELWPGVGVRVHGVPRDSGLGRAGQCMAFAALRWVMGAALMGVAGS